MINAFKNNYFIKKLIQSNKLKLGRWETNTCDKSKNIKFIYANIDNCGDLICGQPIKNKDYIIEKKQMFKKD
tara:strand:- start:1306 stop:1521 length:216 start_codon:yes stop_codon:yes gene_type:complete